MQNPSTPNSDRKIAARLVTRAVMKQVETSISDNQVAEIMLRREAVSDAQMQLNVALLQVSRQFRS